METQGPLAVSLCHSEHTDTLVTPVTAVTQSRKRWSEQHLRLATAVVTVRDRLRTVDWSRLDPHSARTIAACVKMLTAGLKAREYRTAREGTRDAA